MAEQLSEPTVVPISPAVAEVMNQVAGEVDATPSAREQDPATEHNAGANTSRDVENDTAAPRQSAAPPQDGQQPLRVRDIRVGNKDGRGLPILRPGTSPHTLRIPPRGGHPVLRSSSSGGFRSALAVSGFRLRARLGFSIPSSHFGQRGITPAFGYGAPHLSAGGTSTLPIWALPSAHYDEVRLLVSVHHWLRLLAFPMRTAVHTQHATTAARYEISQVPVRSLCT